MERRKMNLSQQKPRFAIGLFLILIGVWLLAVRLIPGFEQSLGNLLGWPMIVVAAGVFLLLLGLVVGSPEMAIPATIVAGTGLLLFYQNANGNWISWSYAWTLYPAFVGIGIILSRLLGSSHTDNYRHGLNLILISLVLFAVFGSFFGGFAWMGPYWPLLLVGAGLVLLLQNLFLRRQ
jgi:hypothetical protein